jgi:hypothetical protein
MADSLIIADAVELLGGSVASAIPQCAGAIFKLQPGYDLSAPQPTTDIVGSMLLDGERPFGRRASNRTIVLPIIIDAPDFATLSAAREVLLQLVDAQTWALTWTRSGGLPIVFDCFRAEPTVVAWGGVDGWLVSPVGALTLTFQAMPYGRSDLPVSLEVASPLPGQPSPLSPVVIDAFTSVVAGQNWAQSAKCVIGPNSARFNPANAPISDPTGQAGHGATYLSATFAGKDITGRSSLTVQAGFGTDYWATWHEGPVVFYWTLTDGSGHTLSFSATRTVHASNSPGSPNWQQVTVPIPAQNAAGNFVFSNVTRYQFNATNRGVGGFRYAQMYLDAVTANPRSAQTPAAVRGAMYSLLGIQGTARAPVSLQFQQAPGTGGTVTVTLPGPAGTPQSWVAPSGVTSVTVAEIAPGGIGGTRTSAGQAGGGGGGESAGQTVTVTPGAISTYNLGAPGTSGADTVFTTDLGTSVTAHRGGSVANNTAAGAAGGTGSAATGYHFNGGTGGTAAGGNAGAGGGSAGSSGAGGNAAGTTGGAAGAGGGVIGASGVAGIWGGRLGGAPGAGGGGASSSTSGTYPGGLGGAGQIKLTYTAPTAAFSTLIAHRPGPDAPGNLSPFVTFSTADTPNGGTEYPVPSLSPGQFADFGGTYTVVAVANGAFSSPGTSRTVTITVKQYEYQGGPSYSTSCARTFTPNTDITNGIIVVGELTLPLKDTAPDNASGLYTVTINDTVTADSYLDCLFLDTMGSTAMINIATAAANLNYFIDEPAADRDLGRVMGSDFDRPQAISVLSDALVSGPPLSVDPGDCLLFAYCVEGAPAFSVTYSPRWFLDRLS